MRHQRKHWEKKRLTMEGKQFFGMQKWKNKGKIRNNCF